VCGYGRGEVYPHTIYECYRTDEVVDAYMDRASGYRVVAIPVWEPDNPTWVDIVRKWVPETLFVLGLAMLGWECDFRDRREANCNITSIEGKRLK